MSMLLSEFQKHMLRNLVFGKMASVELYHLSITNFNRMSLISNGLTFKRKNEAKEVLSLVFVQN